MNGIIVESPKFCSLVSWFFPVAGITLYPFIIVNDKSDTNLITHERIHIKQYSELLVLGFFIIYLYDFFKGCIKYRDSTKAYMSTRFEREAYKYDHIGNWHLHRDRFHWKVFKV